MKERENAMSLLNLLSGPVIGAVIGYITNDIAIRMLFRPHNAVYIFGHRLPFTPGIVPRRKDQLALILGNAIVAKFFNADDLEVIFTSDSFSDAVAERIVLLLKSDATLSSLRDQVPEAAMRKLESELCVRIQAAVCTSDLPEVLAVEGVKMAASLLSSSPAGQALAANLADAVTGPLAREIEEFVIEHGHELLFPLVAQEVERLARRPIGEFTALLAEGHDGELRQAVKSLYLRFMRTHVRPIVESIDVGGMITEKIVLMTSEEVEDLVLTVVNRELRLVVLFGAFVGAIIGAVNIII